MTEFEIESIHANLKEFLKDVNTTDFIALVESICYTGATITFAEHSVLAKKFITEFFSEEVFGNFHWDETHSEQFFLRANITSRELLRCLRIALMQESFSRLKALNR